VTVPLAILSYFVIWHITLFMWLPVKTLTFKRKLLWNCALAAVLTLGIHLLLKSGWVPLRDVIQPI
jgi:hypothetical protein